MIIKSYLSISATLLYTISASPFTPFFFPGLACESVMPRRGHKICPYIIVGASMLPKSLLSYLASAMIVAPVFACSSPSTDSLPLLPSPRLLPHLSEYARASRHASFVPC